MKCFPCRHTLGCVAHQKAHCLALAEALIFFFCVILCWQKLNSVNVCLGSCFQCIRGGSVPPPITCRTLAQAAHRKAHRLTLAEALILFFCVVLCWQNVKIYECLLAMPSFQCIGGGSVPPPITCWTLGWVARRKAHCLALAAASISFLLCRSGYVLCSKPQSMDTRADVSTLYLLGWTLENSYKRDT